ncbi:response regulator transcription factor [Reichenbachiella ulvae]|uniref:Response regulator transcription factor n=1 Tax=Reichenbachiella ulvae TaxID=2980104 RepID=A0ABT3CQ40_9BACT|nr:response regulator transcription factor [Reichenbachiella ulvae]MCV9385833.1 response regulator transcription factor [Reichenbachiella ulvae]
MPLTQTVIIADTNYLSLQGLQLIVSEQPDLELVESLGQLDQVNQFEQNDHNIYIVNISRDTDMLCRKALEWNRKSKVLVISDTRNEFHIQQLWKNGINSIVTNHCSEDEISQAIRHLANDEKFYCNTILDLLTDSKNKTTIEELTNRELEVLDLIVKGKSSKDISEELFLSHHTVNSHRKNILKKLNLKSPAELIIYALDHGFSQ